MSGVYVRQSRNLAFRTPVPVTENDIVHCVIILEGVIYLGFRPALPLTGGSDPRGYVRGVMSANRFAVHLPYCTAHHHHVLY